MKKFKVKVTTVIEYVTDISSDDDEEAIAIAKDSAMAGDLSSHDCTDAFVENAEVVNEEA